MNLENIRVNAQSSIRISGSKVLYFDAFKIEEEKHDADLIFITHDHFDHYDINSISKVKNDNSIIIAPSVMKDVITKEFESSENTCLFVDPDDEIEIEGLTVNAVRSYNVGKPFHKIDKNYVGYMVKMDDVTYFIAGDTDENEDNLKVKCDVAIIPIGGKFTMNPEEAASFVNKISPKAVIPTHYGSEIGNYSDGETFKNLVEDKIIVEIRL